MKGILFKPDMIQAIVDGRKTQTRRVIKPQPDDDGGLTACFSVFDHNITDLARYHAGETVYIKEKALYWDGGAGGRSDPVYADDPEIPQLLQDNNRLLVTRETTNILEGEPIVGRWQWKSALFMGEEDARYFITITGVRAERLQEITWEDVLKEGIGHTIAISQPKWMVIDLFKVTWDSINKEYPWESNPWEFAYTFRRLSQEDTVIDITQEPHRGDYIRIDDERLPR